MDDSPAGSSLITGAEVNVAAVNASCVILEVFEVLPDELRVIESPRGLAALGLSGLASWVPVGCCLRDHSGRGFRLGFGWRIGYLA